MINNFVLFIYFVDINAKRCNFIPAQSNHIYEKYMLIKVNGEAILILHTI